MLGWWLPSTLQDVPSTQEGPGYPQGSNRSTRDGTEVLYRPPKPLPRRPLAVFYRKSWRYSPFLSFCAGCSPLCSIRTALQRTVRARYRTRHRTVRLSVNPWEQARRPDWRSQVAPGQRDLGHTDDRSFRSSEQFSPVSVLRHCTSATLPAMNVTFMSL